MVTFQTNKARVILEKLSFSRITEITVRLEHLRFIGLTFKSPLELGYANGERTE